MVVRVDRTRVLAFRVAAHELDRKVRTPERLASFALGFADTPYGAARLALAARLPADAMPPAELTAGEDPDFPLLWSFRGAPHLHRRSDVAALAEALWPRDDTDVFARLPAERKALVAAGISGLVAFREAAMALRAVVTKSITKGDASHGVTVRLPEAYSYDCRRCEATHIYTGLFQQVGLFAGIRLAGTSPTTLAPLHDRHPVPRQPRGTDEVIRAYLRLLGPATAREVAGYLGTTATTLKPVWPDDLVEVDVDGRRAWITSDQLPALTQAEEPRLVRLLPHADPYLQARDRNLLVPHRDHQKALWRILGSPGALLVDGEVAGIWRAKLTTKNRLDVTVTPFTTLPTNRRQELETEAAHIAAARGASDTRLTVATSS